MSDEIYQLAIKELAKAAHGAGRLAAPGVSVQLDNPLCGDRISLDLLIKDGVIRAIGHETRGCLLCRAAASLIGRQALGLAPARLAAVHASLAALLRGEAAMPDAWPDLAMFAPVRAHRSRHGCVLLPFRALEAALGECRGSP
jgi:NifU-like protein involved in Fe-S cluster formation